MADGAEPVRVSARPVSVLSAGLADADLAGPAEGPAVHDPAELGPTSSALPRRIQSSGPEIKQSHLDVR